jgi:hypothetical protein
MNPNPYRPSEPDNRPRKPEGIQIDFHLLIIPFTVIIGVPLIYTTVLELVDRYAHFIFNSFK